MLASRMYSLKVQLFVEQKVCVMRIIGISHTQLGCVKDFKYRWAGTDYTQTEQDILPPSVTLMLSHLSNNRCTPRLVLGLVLAFAFMSRLLLEIRDSVPSLGSYG